jgi:glucokinase
MTTFRASAVLAVDLGATTMKGAVIADDGTSVATLSRATPVPGALAAVVELTAELHRIAIDRGYRPVAAAVVTPGMVDETAGIVRYASNLEWTEVPLRDQLSSALGIPVAIGHDVRAAGGAEQLIGAGRDHTDILFAQIGTGVAAVQIAEGRAVVGVNGAAGEFGHIPLVQGGELCTCGQSGCLEVYVSGAGLARRYRAAGGEALSSAQISSRVGSEALADQIWKDAVAALAQGLIIMTLQMDPGMIIIGGGFTAAGDTLLAPLREAIRAGLAWRDPAPLVFSALGTSAGVLGAAVLAYRTAGLADVLATWRVRD